MTTSDAPGWLRREQAPGGLELRADAGTQTGDTEARSIFGYGSVAGSPTVIEGAFSEWTEVVEPGAWRQTIGSGRNIRSMFNHDPNRLLGTTGAGTLTLAEDDQGLHYSVAVNADDPQAMSALAQVERGDVSGASVWFRVTREEWTEPTDDNGLERPERRILEASLFEVGPVVFPAFEATSAAARTLGTFDDVLRSAGVTSDAKRADWAHRLLLGDDDLAAELRSLFAAAPDLRDAACSCRRADDGPPEGTPAGSPSPGGLSLHRRRLALLQHPAG